MQLLEPAYAEIRRGRDPGSAAWHALAAVAAAALAESLVPALRDGLSSGDAGLRHRSAVAVILALSPSAW